MQTCKCDDLVNLKQFESDDETTINSKMPPFIENGKNGKPEV